MAQLKTAPTTASVSECVDNIGNETMRADARVLVRLMQGVTDASPVMWGPAIVGFGRYHYRYASGREGDWMLAGFSPRKRELSIYVMSGFEHYDALMEKLGRCRTGKACLYVQQLSDIDLGTLEELVRHSVERLRQTYG